MTQVKALISADWLVRPLGLQKLLKRCPGCNQKREFEPSSSFRVNSQKKLIDIWHIYKCSHCQYTWNIEIASRLNVSEVGADVIEPFIINDSNRVIYSAFDYKNLSRLGVTLAPPPDFSVEGQFVDIKAQYGRVNVHFDVYFPVRQELIIARKLDISRSKIRNMMLSGRIRLLDGQPRRPSSHGFSFEFGDDLK